MRCEECQQYFTPSPKTQGYEPELRRQAIKLYLEGVSLRGIGRQLSITHQSVSNWINTYHDNLLPQQVEDDTPTQVVEVDEEIDELYTSVGKKEKRLCSDRNSTGEQADRWLQGAQGVALDSNAGVCRSSA